MRMWTSLNQLIHVLFGVIYIYIYITPKRTDSQLSSDNYMIDTMMLSEGGNSDHRRIAHVTYRLSMYPYYMEFSITQELHMLSSIFNVLHSCALLHVNEPTYPILNVTSKRANYFSFITLGF